MSEELAEAVREILDKVPGSDMELARASGVPQSTISRVRNGERGCTPEVARALVDALDGWTENCADARDHLRHTLDREE